MEWPLAGVERRPETRTPVSYPAVRSDVVGDMRRAEAPPSSWPASIRRPLDADVPIQLSAVRADAGAESRARARDAGSQGSGGPRASASNGAARPAADHAPHAAAARTMPPPTPVAAPAVQLKAAPAEASAEPEQASAEQGPSSAAPRSFAAAPGAPPGDAPDAGGVMTRSRMDDPVRRAAEAPLAETGRPLPFLSLIQSCFGRHDISGISTHFGASARAANHVLGSRAYAMGNHVVCADDPSLHTCAHEAAHVIQQRAGVHLKDGFGRAGDEYERHADQVADQVVQGRSAEALLDRFAGHGAAAPGAHWTGAPIQRESLTEPGHASASTADPSEFHAQQPGDTIEFRGDFNRARLVFSWRVNINRRHKLALEASVASESKKAKISERVGVSAKAGGTLGFFDAKYSPYKSDAQGRVTREMAVALFKADLGDVNFTLDGYPFIRFKLDVKALEAKLKLGAAPGEKDSPVDVDALKVGIQGEANGPEVLALLFQDDKVPYAQFKNNAEWDVKFILRGEIAVSVQDVRHLVEVIRKWRQISRAATEAVRHEAAQRAQEAAAKQARKALRSAATQTERNAAAAALRRAETEALAARGRKIAAKAALRELQAAEVIARKALSGPAAKVAAESVARVAGAKLAVAIGRYLIPGVNVAFLLLDAYTIISTLAKFAAGDLEFGIGVGDKDAVGGKDKRDVHRSPDGGTNNPAADGTQTLSNRRPDTNDPVAVSVKTDPTDSRDLGAEGANEPVAGGTAVRVLTDPGTGHTALERSAPQRPTSAPNAAPNAAPSTPPKGPTTTTAPPRRADPSAAATRGRTAPGSARATKSDSAPTLIPEQARLGVMHYDAGRDEIVVRPEVRSFLLGNTITMPDGLVAVIEAVSVHTDRRVTTGGAAPKNLILATSKFTLRVTSVPADGGANYPYRRGQRTTESFQYWFDPVEHTGGQVDYSVSDALTRKLKREGDHYILPRPGSIVRIDGLSVRLLAIDSQSRQVDDTGTNLRVNVVIEPIAVPKENPGLMINGAFKRLLVGQSLLVPLDFRLAAVPRAPE